MNHTFQLDSKFFLIGFPRGLRVAIGTANLIYSDQHNKSNGVGVQDFPYKSVRDYNSMASSSFEEVHTLSNGRTLSLSLTHTHTPPNHTHDPPTPHLIVA